MTVRSPSRRWLPVLLVSLSLLMALVAMPTARAAGESDVFARILDRVAGQKSLTVGRYLLRNSPELREMSRTILGADAAGVADDLLAETAVRRLQQTGDQHLAQNLEQRLLSAERDFVTEMEAAPAADVDQLLARLSAERFQFHLGAAPHAHGPAIEFKDPVPPSLAERQLADALHADPALGRLRETVHTTAAVYPARSLNETLAAYDALTAPGAHAGAAELAKLLPKGLVYRTLGDIEQSELAANLKAVIEHVAKAPAAQSPEEKIRHALQDVLHGQVPAASIPGRVHAFLAGEPGAFTRALGEMTLTETQILYHGGNPLAPTPESLVGQYLHETGATTLVRTFDDASAQELGQAGAQGPQKLVVSLSEKSLPVFMKLFKRKDWMSSFNHAFIVHDGTVTTFNRVVSDFRVPGSEYTPFPMVLLKPTEGARMAQYMELWRRDPFDGPWGNWNNTGSSPWKYLQDYCATHAWGGGCTQHIGNMPIGDERVLEYTVASDQAGGPARVQRLKPYASDDALAKRVWKVPGNMQLGELIGLQGANLRGELANPGWVISSLLGPASADRVPIVFVTRADHTLPIKPDFVPVAEHRM